MSSLFSPQNFNKYNTYLYTFAHDSQRFLHRLLNWIHTHKFLNCVQFELKIKSFCGACVPFSIAELERKGWKKSNRFVQWNTMWNQKYFWSRKSEVHSSDYRIKILKGVWIKIQPRDVNRVEKREYISRRRIEKKLKFYTRSACNINCALEESTWDIKTRVSWHLIQFVKRKKWRVKDKWND